MDSLELGINAAIESLLRAPFEEVEESFCAIQEKVISFEKIIDFRESLKEVSMDAKLKGSLKEKIRESIKPTNLGLSIDLISRLVEATIQAARDLKKRPNQKFKESDYLIHIAKATAMLSYLEELKIRATF